MLKVKDIYLLGRDICTNNGGYTGFWKDTWLYQQHLCTIAPELFEPCENKDITVDKVRSNEMEITFRRWLPQDLRLQWEQIWAYAGNFIFGNESDRIIWSLEKNYKFSMKSAYNALTRNEAGNYLKLI